MKETPVETTSPTPSINGVVSKAASPPPHHQQNGSDPDAQEMVISSLRSQIQDLFSQVTQLNGKLVKSYDRVSDLEDELHMAAAGARQASLKISQLELERTQYLSALNTGLLVEKSQVTAELTRLMEKATDEAAQRGQAENAKADIEKDLDDLSATLFAQANTMVAEARYAQAMTERRVEQAETALKGAEEMAGIMQQQMQTLQAEKDEAERKSKEMQVVMGKGKWVDRRSAGSGVLPKETRLLSSHLPYQEFLLLVAHLRSVHPSSSSPPAMTTLLPMAFLARLSSEDSEPTIRLDLAPSLNWLSRRSVLAAIHTGQLTIEPMSSSALLSESTSNSGSTNTNIPGLNSSSTNISCALCGTPIFSSPDNPMSHHHPRPPTHPALNNGPNNFTSVFKKTLGSYTAGVNGSPPSTPQPPPRSLSRPHSHQLPAAPVPYPPQIHVFRIATPLPPPQPMNPPTRSSSPSPFLPSVGSSRAAGASPPQPSNTNALTNLSFNALTQSASAASTIYPLCSSGWCLARLRTTCTLWAFVRTGIVERVWEEEVPNLPTTPPQPDAAAGAGGPPPVPPRRRGLWGMASKLGERAVSWSGDGKDKKPEGEKKVEEKGLPTPPPVHPTISMPTPARATPAPPLPKRSESRARPLSTIAPRPPSPDEPKAASPDLPNPHPVPVSAVAALAGDAKKQKRFSAHQVPLPDSRPGTPVVAAAAFDSPPAASDAPAVTDAPAGQVPEAPAAAVPEAPAGAAPTPGTAPPPLPRRAAARATRPAPPSRPETPSGVAKEGAEPAKVVETPAAVAGADESAKTAPPEVEKAAEVDAAPPKVEEEHPTKAAGEDVGEQGATETTKEADAVNMPRAESPVPEESVKVVDKEKPSVNGDASEEKMAEEKKDEDDDHEAYIGDVTWEERTWKELVRLREDMFWARIGGLRS